MACHCCSNTSAMWPIAYLASRTTCAVMVLHDDFMHSPRQCSHIRKRTPDILFFPHWMVNEQAKPSLRKRLERAGVRHARTCSTWPDPRYLTAKESHKLNRILASSSTSRSTHARVRLSHTCNERSNGHQLTAKASTQVNSIFASAAKRRTTALVRCSSAHQLNPVPERNSKLLRQKLPKDDIQRCNELKQWYKNHSGQRPRRRSDDQTEVSLALWLDRSLIRRTRAVNNRPCARQLTATETIRLNSILARAMAPPTKDHLELCNEVKQPHVGIVATSKRLRQKETEPECSNKLDMKSSHRVMKKRCMQLGLQYHGDKQVLLARILNKENSLAIDRHVMDGDTDQEMLKTWRGS